MAVAAGRVSRSSAKNCDVGVVYFAPGYAQAGLMNSNHLLVVEEQVIDERCTVLEIIILVVLGTDFG